MKEQTPRRGLCDGPWPHVHVGGELEHAEAEWLLANDQGAYAMSTVAFMHTRRQHGILVTHLGDDFRRHVVLSHLEMTLETGGRVHQLSTHQFPNVAPTPGYRLLESFTQDPLPRWVFRLPHGTVERTINLVRGHRAVVTAFTWSGKEPALLKVRPLMPMRYSEALCSEHGAMMQKVTLRSGEVEVQPVVELPPVVFRHSGVFMGSPDWWRKFEYLDDRGRYEDFQEDMWSPGTFEITLQPRRTEYLVAFVGRPPEGRPEDLVMAAAQHLLGCDPGQSSPAAVRALAVAADCFVLGEGEAIVAGFPWLDVWSRDWLLCLPGTCLARQQVARAERSLCLLLERLVDGFLPQRLTATEEKRTPCVDASLWAFPVALRVIEAAAEPEAFLAEILPALRAMFARLTANVRSTAWLTEDGLLANAGPGPLTWMDARAGDTAFTPRQGLAVELQGLWVQAALSFAVLCEQAGDLEEAERARVLAQTAVRAFGRRFWNSDTHYPFDCIGPGGESGSFDAAIRPNALIALAVAPGLFEPWQRREILARVEELLLTPRGLRTLDPNHPQYVGNGAGTIEERRAASHQGTVWPHLLLYYVRAKLHEAPEMREELSALATGALAGERALGHVSQNADGDAPHHFRGSPAYGAATAMLLEALVLDLGVDP